MIEEIIKDTKKENGYDKEAYKKMKREQLQNTYKMIDDACEELKNGNIDFFKDYLNIQSRFDKYTIRNALLVAKQFPNAMQLKDRKSWRELKVTFNNKTPNKILILEPGESYINKDGKKTTPYNAKELIDISETNSKPNIKYYDKKIILQALLHICPIDIKAVDKIDVKDNVMCMWDKENNIVNVCRSDDYDLVINSLAKEISKINLYEETSEISDDKAQCIGYMISKKYNIDCSLDNVSNIFKDKEVSDIKNELSSMKNVLDDTNNRIGQYIDDKTKEIKNKDKEMER